MTSSQHTHGKTASIPGFFHSSSYLLSPVTELRELVASLDLPQWLHSITEALQSVAAEWAGPLRVQAVGLLEMSVRVMAVGGGVASDLITLVHRTCLLMAAEPQSQCIVRVSAVNFPYYSAVILNYAIILI